MVLGDLAFNKSPFTIRLQTPLHISPILSKYKETFTAEKTILKSLAIGCLFAKILKVLSSSDN